MSVDVEQLVAEITRRVVHEVLEALAVPTTVEDDYPDWDEYVDKSGVLAEPAYEAGLSGQLGRVSPLRARLQGELEPAIEELPEDEDIEALAAGTSAGDVVPLSVDSFGERRGGFDPRANPSWFNAQYQRDVVLPSRVAPKG